MLGWIISVKNYFLQSKQTDIDIQNFEILGF